MAAKSWEETIMQSQLALSENRRAGLKPLLYLMGSTQSGIPQGQCDG